LPFLRERSERDPNNETLKLFLANEYKRAGDRRQAEALFVQVAQGSPSPEVYRDLVDLWKEEGRPGLEKILELMEKKLGEKATGEVAVEMAPGRALLLALRDDGALMEQLMPVIQTRLSRNGKGLNPSTCYYLAVLVSRTRKLELAERMYQSCL